MMLSSVSHFEVTRSWKITEAPVIFEVCVSLLWYVHLCVYRQTRAQKVLGELPGGTSARKLLNRFSTIHLESNSRIIVFARRLLASPKRLLKFPRFRRTKFKKEGTHWKRRQLHRHYIWLRWIIIMDIHSSSMHFSFSAGKFFRDSSWFLLSH